MTIHAYATPAAKAPLEPFDYVEAPLGADDVEVAITHCGICHSDLHMIENDWSNALFPLVPGHEIIGHVTQKGDRVTGLEIGQRVGIGWQRSACLSCQLCLESHDNLCPNSTATIVGNHGGFADRIRSDAHFVFPIPDKLDSENAAPLLCAGGTVYSPLVLYGVEPSMRVAVVGIGGLGHLALQFLAAWGCEVTAISSSSNKETEAKQFGASSFLHAEPEALKQAAGAFDFILSTVPSGLDWPVYLNLLRPNGKFCLVGVASAPLQFPAAALILTNRTVCGSAIANRARMRDMLDFAARHDIKAQTESLPLNRVNEALERLRNNQVRYRMVLSL
jgi:uncharacterized zinc-type alcohol dehydrogenase-like protein